MECCQAHHAGQQGPDNYADKQILGCLQLHPQLRSTVDQIGHSLGAQGGLIPGGDGSPSYSEDSRGETQELQTKTG